MRPSGIERVKAYQLFRITRALFVGGKQSGVGRAGADDVDGDSMARMFARYCFGERDEPALAGRIDRFARGTDPRGVGGDVDDAAAPSRRHARQHRVMHMQRARQVDRDELIPLGRFGLGERAKNVPAGVVDEHVDRPERGFGCGHRVVDAGAICDVAAKGLGEPAGVADLGGDLFGRFDGDVEHRDFRALGGEATAGRPANTAAAARNDDHFTGETTHILLLPRPCQFCLSTFDIMTIYCP